MSEGIFIETYEGRDVHFLRGANVFRVLFDDDTSMEASALSDLHEDVSRVHAKMCQQQRANWEPVSVVLCQENGVERVDVLGIVARRYDNAIKTKQGQRQGLHALNVVALGDCRESALREMVEHLKRLYDAYNTMRERYLAMLKLLPQVTVPRVMSKEDALDKEPAFLAELRALEPMKE